MTRLLCLSTHGTVILFNHTYAPICKWPSKNHTFFQISLDAWFFMMVTWKAVAKWNFPSENSTIAQFLENLGKSTCPVWVLLRRWAPRQKRSPSKINRVSCKEHQNWSENKWDFRFQNWQISDIFDIFSGKCLEWVYFEGEYLTYSPAFLVFFAWNSERLATTLPAGHQWKFHQKLPFPPLFRVTTTKNQTKSR